MDYAVSRITACESTVTLVRNPMLWLSGNQLAPHSLPFSFMMSKRTWWLRKEDAQLSDYKCYGPHPDSSLRTIRVAPRSGLEG